jgi:hypothetical protein
MLWGILDPCQKSLYPADSMSVYSRPMNKDELSDTCIQKAVCAIAYIQVSVCWSNENIVPQIHREEIRLPSHIESCGSSHKFNNSVLNSSTIHKHNSGSIRDFVRGKLVWNRFDISCGKCWSEIDSILQPWKIYNAIITLIQVQILCVINLSNWRRQHFSSSLTFIWQYANPPIP